jgi:hypothetical protein
MLILTEWLVHLATAYLIVGAAFWVPFARRGAARIDPHAREATWGFRLIILPGTALLWPILAWRWVSGATTPAEEWNAHRAAARQMVGAPARPNRPRVSAETAASCESRRPGANVSAPTLSPVPVGRHRQFEREGERLLEASGREAHT